METIDQIIQGEVEQTCHQTSPSTSKPFWVGDSVDAFKDLLRHYKAAVAETGQEFRADIDTLRHIEKIALWLTEPSNKRGIYLGGSCGNGKTTLMKAFERVCKDRGMRVLRTSAPKMVSWHLQDHSIFDLPHQEKVICIDDLGTESAEVMVYGNKLSIMADFFEEAYKTRCFLFVTSNLGAKEIEERYGERVRDRFREIFHSMKFSNPSFR